MSRRYKVQILNRKVGRWVELDDPYDSSDFAHHRYLTEDDMVEIDRWVLQHDLGRRQSFDMWQLDDDRALTMFLLKWGE